MFELPNAKRVKRSKIFSSFSSSEDEASLSDSTKGHRSHPTKSSLEPKTRTSNSSNAKVDDTASDNGADNTYDQMKIDYGFEYEFIDLVQPISTNQTTNKSNTLSNIESKDPDDPATAQAQNQPASQTYEFNLFAPTSTATSTDKTKAHSPSQPDAQTNPTQKPTLITLRPPTPPSNPLDPFPLHSGRILKPRPLHQALTSALPESALAAQRASYLTVALSGPAIQALSTSPWPGTALPWRVISIPKEKLTLVDPFLSAPVSGAKERRRARPSKKRRIELRKRIAAREAVQLATVGSGEAEREKRTRRNREKKVKRKMREKMKKAAVLGGDVGQEKVEDGGNDKESEGGSGCE